MYQETEFLGRPNPSLLGGPHLEFLDCHPAVGTWEPGLSKHVIRTGPHGVAGEPRTFLLVTLSVEAPLTQMAPRCLEVG